jgi:two-component system, NarL family, sensor histidine kinase DegS
MDPKLRGDGSMLKTKSPPIMIMINDNGAGFDTSKIDTPTAVKSAFGILNIHERLNHLGGDITIESKPGKGTSVVVTVPIQKHLQNL